MNQMMQNGVTRLYPDQASYFILAGMCMTFILLVVLGLGVKTIVFNWISGLIIAGVALLAGWAILVLCSPGRVYLQLDQDGLTARTFFSCLKLRWADIEGFYLVTTGGETSSEELRIRLWDVPGKLPEKQDGAAAATSSVHQVGDFKAIHCCYGMHTFLDLANLLDAHLQRYRQQHATE